MPIAGTCVCHQGQGLVTAAKPCPLGECRITAGFRFLPPRHTARACRQPCVGLSPKMEAFARAVQLLSGLPSTAYSGSQAITASDTLSLLVFRVEATNRPGRLRNLLEGTTQDPSLSIQGLAQLPTHGSCSPAHRTGTAPEKGLCHLQRLPLSRCATVACRAQDSKTDGS